MTYVVLGLSVLIGLGLMGRWLLSANPSTLWRVLKWVGIVVLGLGGLFILFRGRLDYVFYAATVVLPFLLRWGGMFNRLRTMAKSARGPSAGQSSEVKTRFLVMTLDHDTGGMSGRVTRGAFEGASLDALSREEMVELWHEVSDDPQSVQVLEAWIDRTHGEDWRNGPDAAPASGAGAGNGSGSASGAQTGGEAEMTRAYALALLGLEEGASEADIRAAHKRLMMANHPDRGGSSVIAAQINRAKDLLLEAK
jgi:hypothetical protein